MSSYIPQKISPCLPAGRLTPLCPPGQAPPQRGFCPGGRPYGPAAKEGEYLPFVKGGKEGFILQCLHNYGLTYDEERNTEMNQSRNVAILIFDEVEVLDFCGPFEVFSVKGRQDNSNPFNVYPVVA